MRSIKLKKEQRPTYEPKKDEKSQKIGNRDIPLGGPTTVTDTTFYGRAKSMMPEQPTPKPNVPKAMKAQQEQEAREKEKEARDALKRARQKLDKDPYKPLNPKA